MERWGGLENLKNASDRAKKIIHNLKLSVAAKVCNTSCISLLTEPSHTKISAVADVLPFSCQFLSPNW